MMPLKRWLVGPSAGVAMGASYGLLLRVGMGRHSGDGSTKVLVMTLCFLVFGPLAIGNLTVTLARVQGWHRIVLPWVPMLLSAGAAWICNLEGWICVVFALPITLVFASMGGLLARHEKEGPGKLLQAAVLMVVPLAGAPIEARFAQPPTYRAVSNEIRIEASREKVWRNIERVRAIAPGELRETWAQKIGFPRPVEATLSYEGVGGVRHASFERGLMFVETVTAWNPGRRLAFGIRADTEHLPPTTLDEHVKVGGRYFDVLDGEYRIEPLAAGGVMLHLQSRERLSTDFNWYAGWWSDRVMTALQGSILEVIRHRCETGK